MIYQDIKETSINNVTSKSFVNGSFSKYSLKKKLLRKDLHKTLKV
jgi:hypothetical protein